MIKFILLIIFVEAMTEILTTSMIFDKPRSWLANKSAFLGELIHCGYCTSVWVAASIAWAYPIPITIYFMINYIISIFVLHRCSNFVHEIIAKFLGRRPLAVSVYKTETVIMSPGPEDEQRTL